MNNIPTTPQGNNTGIHIVTPETLNNTPVPDAAGHNNHGVMGGATVTPVRLQPGDRVFSEFSGVRQERVLTEQDFHTPPATPRQDNANTREIGKNRIKPVDREHEEEPVYIDKVLGKRKDHDDEPEPPAMSVGNNHPIGVH
jgi:hypothetical protein